MGGAWFTQTCYEQVVEEGDTRLVNNLGAPLLVWRQTAPEGMPNTFTTGQIAMMLTNNLPLPVPVIHRKPSLTDNDQATVVNLYTWYWADLTSISDDQTQPLSLYGTTLQLRRHGSLSLNFGDGTPAITCTDGGTPPKGPHDDVSKRPSDSHCDHIYRKTSIDAPGQKFTAIYTTTWTVQYSLDGTTWTDLLTTPKTSTDNTRVIQIQVVNIPVPTR